MGIYVVDKFGREKHAEIELATSIDKEVSMTDTTNTLVSGTPYSGNKMLYPMTVHEVRDQNSTSTNLAAYYAQTWPFYARTSTLDTFYHYINAAANPAIYFTYTVWETIDQFNRMPCKKVFESVDNVHDTRYWNARNVNWSGFETGRMYWMTQSVVYTSTISQLCIANGYAVSTSYNNMFFSSESSGSSFRAGVASLRPWPRTATSTSGNYEGGPMPNTFFAAGVGGSQGVLWSSQVMPLYYGLWT